MHPQIRHAISRLQFSPGSVLLELNAPERSPLGEILYIVYYHTNICDVVNRGDRSGYPHNGGQHTFDYRASHGDVVSLVELIKETVMGKFSLSDEARQVANELSFISQEILARRKLK